MFMPIGTVFKRVGQAQHRLVLIAICWKFTRWNVKTQIIDGYHQLDVGVEGERSHFLRIVEVLNELEVVQTNATPPSGRIA